MALLDQSAGWEDRISALERDNQELNKAFANLQKQVRQRELDAAYMYVHSNWLWIRWVLGRDQDRSAEDSELYRRARAAELTIRDNLTRNLRAVQFDPQPMDVAYRWRIETTVTLNQHRYTFFD